MDRWCAGRAGGGSSARNQFVLRAATPHKAIAQTQVESSSCRHMCLGVLLRMALPNLTKCLTYMQYESKVLGFRQESFALFPKETMSHDGTKSSQSILNDYFLNVHYYTQACDFRPCFCFNQSYKGRRMWLFSILKLSEIFNILIIPH